MKKAEHNMLYSYNVGLGLALGDDAGAEMPPFSEVPFLLYMHSNTIE
jgi:hypothetical protein